jgi:hypothetical protein
MNSDQDNISREQQLQSIYPDNPILPDLLRELSQKISSESYQELLALLIKRDGAYKLPNTLKATFSFENSASQPDELRAWEIVGLVYRNGPRYYEAINVFEALYDQLLSRQQSIKEWRHKGLPLIYISDCYKEMGCPVLAKRYFMLALIDDAIRGEGVISAEETGVYFRAVRWYGLTDGEISEYAKQVYDYWTKNTQESLFPELVLLEFEKDWMTEYPSSLEAGMYPTNIRLVNHLLSSLGEPTGKILEQLAEYILFCMPGCRTMRRGETPSTDYDIVCSMVGLEADFRSELGRYFLCECKDWTQAADFTSFAKFCRVLDSVKSRFGILFSKSGITGTCQSRNAEREQLKVFQDRGMVIVVIDYDNLRQVADGVSFIKILRAKYESVRLDLKSIQS